MFKILPNRFKGPYPIIFVGYLFFLIIICFPLVWMLMTSLKNANEIISYPPNFLPRTITFENFNNLLKNTGFLTYFKNSLIVGFCVVILTNTVAVAGAYSLSRFQYYGREKISILTLYSYMFAPVMLMVPYYIIMTNFNLVDTRLSLILAQSSFCFPFALWLLRSFFADIPRVLEEAASLDGANRLQTIIHIVLPAARPGIITTSIFTFILSWNDYIFARILISSDSLKTISVGIQDIYESTVLDWGMLMAAGVVVAVPILIVFIYLQRYLIKGWASGGTVG